LVAAAEASSLRVGTYVLDTGVLSPAYLARDVADVQRLTDGRLELGLGTGYVPGESEAVGKPFGTGGERLRTLEKTLPELYALLVAEPDLPAPPIMLSGAGDRMLRFGGREADIFSFSIFAGLTPGVLVGSPAEIADRLRRYREQHGVSYISVLEPHLDAFAEVIALLR